MWVRPLNIPDVAFVEWAIFRKKKTCKDQCIMCNCFSLLCKEYILAWWSVFLKCLLYSKLSLERQDNNCCHRLTFVIIFSCCYALLYFWKLLSQIICALCSVDRASRYNRVKKNQLDAQLILSIFRQPLHVSGVSRPIIRSYNQMYTTVGTYYSF